MRKIIVFIFALAIYPASTHAENPSTGPTSFTGAAALALAALVSTHAPNLTDGEKQVLSSMLNGDLTFTFPPDGQITVAADSVTCRASNVDISEHDCMLKFGGASRSLKGREAHELYATLIENGVVADGAAGSVYASVSQLECTIKPGEVKQKAGGGAACSSKPGP